MDSHFYCVVDGCTNKIVSNSLCDKHRKRLERHGHLRNTRPYKWGEKSKHPLWQTWKWMRRMRFKSSIHESWDDFWQFVKDVGDRPSPQHRLRKKNSKHGYGPDNFEWKMTIPSANKAEAQRIWRARNPDKVRNTDLLRHHGITLDEYNQMLKDQRGVCAICNTECEHFSLAVDHCHETQKIRGLLCSKCNRGLGLFRDSPELLTAASEYLKRSN